MATEKTESGSFGDFIRLMKQNRYGFVGFCLSVLQIVAHGCWMAFATHLASTGQAEGLTSDDWQMWVIAILIIIGAILTAVSLFLCLYGAIHGKPKILAIIGLCISFFVGVLTTFTLIVNAAQG